VALTDDDVREILRLIDESGLDELRIETADFKLHVRRGDPSAAPEASAVSDPAPTPAPAPAPAPTDAKTIEAPMPGIFHRAEAPGAQPFVAVGTPVEPGTVVGIIEVMKMMNSVPAGVAGAIAEVCVENAEIVEEGQTLFRVGPGS
jgi:acetyl-CoA carboxylase biotin carboxyl carrier protein